MEYAVIFCYKTDIEGNFQEDEDLQGILVNKGSLDPELAVDQGVLDIFLEEQEFKTTLKFEIYNVKYLGVTNEDDESLIERIKQDMISLLETGELEYLSDYEFYAEVHEDPESYLQE